MKKLILIALAFISIQAFAQTENREGRRGKMKNIKNLSAEDAAELGTKKMTLAFDLTESQQSEVMSILLDEAKFRKQKMQEREARREELKKVRPSQEERLEMKKEKLDRQIEMKQKIKSVLDEEQYAKWESQMEQRRTQRQGKGRKNGKKQR